MKEELGYVMNQFYLFKNGEEMAINKEVAKELEKIKDKLEWIIEGAATGDGKEMIAHELIKIKNSIKEKLKQIESLETEHTANGDLKKNYTSDLCNELQNREGVNHMMIDPYAIKEVTIKAEGPARVFIVYD